MAFPQSFMDELIARNPIEEVVSQYVSLTRRGSNLFGLCPFHNEKTGSFSVKPEKGIYYCFGCHKGGGAVNFIMEIENLDFPDAVRLLAKRAGLEVPEDNRERSGYKRKERLWALSAEAARYFHDKLQDKQVGRAARQYLSDRGMTAGTVTRFGLGFAPDGWSGLIEELAAKGYSKQEILDAGLATKNEKGNIYDRFRNRVMYPIIDISGHVIGFGGRVMDDSKPKYLNSPETEIFNKRRNLFALNLAKKTKEEQIILTEGYMDAIALYQYGFDCAVASLGTSLTEEQANLIGKYTKKIVLTYDGDAAGQNATQRAIPMLEKAGLEVRVLRMQGAKDPDEFLKKYGADKFRVLLSGTQSQMEYRLQAVESKYNLENDDERVGYLKEAANEISKLPSPVEREIYGARAAEKAKVSAETMKQEVNNAYKSRLRAERRKAENELLKPTQTVQPQSREFHYENLRSGRAEERVVSLLMKDENLFGSASGLSRESFSVPVFGKAFEVLRGLWSCGSTGGIAAAAEQFTPSELQLLTEIYAKYDDQIVSESEFADCVRVIREENSRAKEKSSGDLEEMFRRMQRKHGVN